MEQDRAKQSTSLVDQCTPAPQYVAEARPAWACWTPPPEAWEQAAYRERVKRTIVIAHLAVAHNRAGKDDCEERDELQMLCYALGILKSLGHQLANARTRQLRYEKRAKDIRSNIGEIENQDARATVQHLEQALAE